jgi:hypothetical protein
MVPIAIGSFALLVVVAYLIARPIFAPEARAPEAGESRALADKQRLLADIRELDMDFATGKLAEDDYQELRTDTLARAAEAARALDEARKAEPAAGHGPGAGSEESEGNGSGGGVPASDSRGSASDHAPSQDPIEREIAERKRSMRERGCATCGAIREPEDRSCRGCGAGLATTGTR